MHCWIPSARPIATGQMSDKDIYSAVQEVDVEDEELTNSTIDDSAVPAPLPTMAELVKASLIITAFTNMDNSLLACKIKNSLALLLRQEWAKMQQKMQPTCITDFFVQ